MLICQCCFAIAKVLLKKVTYLLTEIGNGWWNLRRNISRATLRHGLWNLSTTSFIWQAPNKLDHRNEWHVWKRKPTL